MQPSYNHPKNSDAITQAHKIMQAVDDLPPELRTEICFAARVWNALDVLEIYQKEKPIGGHIAVVRWLAQSIQIGDEEDIQAFAYKFRRAYGMPLPHVAADATILRYQPPAHPKRYRHLGNMPKLLRKAWQASDRLMPVVLDLSQDVQPAWAGTTRFAEIMDEIELGAV